MNIEDIRNKTDDELSDDLLALKKESFNLRFQRASGQLENTARVREARRDVAKIETVKTERRRVASAASGKA